MTVFNLHNSILNIVETNSKEWFNEYLPLPDIRCFIASQNSERYGNIKFFIFHKNANIPIAIAKLARSSDGFKNIKHEYDKLVEVNLLSNKISGVPIPFYYGEINKNCFLIESFLTGISIRNNFIKILRTNKADSRAEDILCMIISWLKNFHLASAKTLSSLEIKKIWQKSEVNLDEKLQGPIVVGIVHGDFWINNILMDGSNINVIDWEWCESDLPLIWDLFFFFLAIFKKLVSYSPYKGTPEELVKVIKNREHWLVDFMDKIINEYLSFFSIDKKNLVPLQRSLLIYLSQRNFRRYGFENEQDSFWKQVLNVWQI